MGPVKVSIACKTEWLPSREEGPWNVPKQGGAGLVRAVLETQPMASVRG